MKCLENLLLFLLPDTTVDVQQKLSKTSLSTLVQYGEKIHSAQSWQ